MAILVCWNLPVPLSPFQAHWQSNGMWLGLVILYLFFLFLFFLISTLFSRALSLCVRFFFSFLFLVSFLGYPVSVRQQFLEVLEWEEFCPANGPPSPDVSHPEFCPAAIPPHPDVSHPEFCPAAIPPPPDILHPEFCLAKHSISSGCLISGILSGRRSTTSSIYFFDWEFIVFKLNFESFFH